jgi:N-methylhydantoinase B/oxoprolinase/acetone carboxylase alpha subunit
MSKDIREMIDKVKNFKQFVNENNNNMKQTLYNIAKQARDYVNVEYNLGGSFGDYCDVVAEKVAELLSNKGISGKIVYGDYYHQYENSEPDYYGHTWVVVDNYIVDASREQFDSKEYIINIKDESSANYEMNKIVSTF